MELTQSFRLIGSMDIEEIPCDHVDEHHVVYWEDIENVFPGAKYVKNGSVCVNMMRDSNRIRITPHCIKHYPGVVLDVVLSSAANSVHDDSPRSRSEKTFEVAVAGDMTPHYPASSALVTAWKAPPSRDLTQKNIEV
ncbi:hypothetical protein BG015_005736, partial [Linnemannia schmuckeri]